jgi:hypothetical protein
MAIVTLASGSGAPGVTTTVLALALTWPRPVLLIEADPTGASAISAGWFRGRPPHNRGLVNLAMAHRQGDITESIRDVTLHIEGSTVDVVAGIRSPAQAPTIASIWEPLSTALHGMERLGTDVLVDAGRLGLVGAPMPLLRASDAVLLTTRATIPAVAGARGWATTLKEDFAGLGLTQNLGLAIVGDGRPYQARELSKLLGLPAVATLAWDPVNAETFSIGRDHKRGLERGSLARSVRAAASAIQSMVATNRARLHQGTLIAPEART